MNEKREKLLFFDTESRSAQEYLWPSIPKEG